MQRRAAEAILTGRDCIISAETGSGKTLAFVMPALSRLSYPPEVYLDDFQARTQYRSTTPTSEFKTHKQAKAEQCYVLLLATLTGLSSECDACRVQSSSFWCLPWSWECRWATSHCLIDPYSMITFVPTPDTPTPLCLCTWQYPIQGSAGYDTELIV